MQPWLKLKMNNMLVRSVLFFVLIFLNFHALNAQDEEGGDFKKRRIPFSIGIDGGISSIATPNAFQNNFNSAGDASMLFDFGISSKFSASALLRYSALQVRSTMVNIADSANIMDNGITSTRLNLFSQGIGLNYLSWLGDYTFLSTGLYYGNTMAWYTKLRSDFKGDAKDAAFNTRFIEPRILLTYYFEDHFAMNVRMGYTHVFGYFSPEKIGLNNGVISYESSDLKSEIGYFTVGLGFTWSLKRID
jgi:hypothetical protein